MCFPPGVPFIPGSFIFLPSSAKNFLSLVPEFLLTANSHGFHSPNEIFHLHSEGNFTEIPQWQLFSLSIGNGFCFLMASMISCENSAVIEMVILLLVMGSFSLIPPFFFWV